MGPHCHYCFLLLYTYLFSPLRCPLIWSFPFFSSFPAQHYTASHVTSLAVSYFQWGFLPDNSIGVRYIRILLKRRRVPLLVRQRT
ncbi:hypothetical protein BOTBODRAFT_398922 [Botryobasidium botryosum FD-172 SS1]|uniref:Uncharacterized protein n=1 Tax=Botryobasidium botryosum (strain FD-172 SS1) TaxID=930990 RepID=A0A067MCD7_BOTB1|nr:hypothetical protein BOTBODRAFT_398922 [Botryobasidium botryosum FD-172 SS1]